MEDTNQSGKAPRADCCSTIPVPLTRACLSYEEVSARTGLSLSTLRRRVKEGKLPFIQPGGRRTRIVFPLDVIERLLQAADTSSSPKHAVQQPISVPVRKVTVSRGPRPKWLQTR